MNQDFFSMMEKYFYMYILEDSEMYYMNWQFCGHLVEGQFSR